MYIDILKFFFYLLNLAFNALVNRIKILCECVCFLLVFFSLSFSFILFSSNVLIFQDKNEISQCWRVVSKSVGELSQKLCRRVVLSVNCLDSLDWTATHNVDTLNICIKKFL